MLRMNALQPHCLSSWSHPCLLPFQPSLQVQELFSKSGDVKRIIIGLDKVKKTACGFCFVEYPLPSVSFYSHSKHVLQHEGRCLLICSLVNESVLDLNPLLC